MMNDEDYNAFPANNQNTSWAYAGLVLLGLWNMVIPFIFNAHISVTVPFGRTLWLTDTQRVTLIKWSDVSSGFFLILFGSRALIKSKKNSLWICCFTGIWLNIAPLVFWAPTIGSYLNDVVTGMLSVCCSVLIPGLPGKTNDKLSVSPPGWSYNPSSWPQRGILIILAFIGFILSAYLTAYQFGYIHSVWDPFPGSGTVKVLNSSISRSLPVADAGVGALAYTFYFLLGFLGGPLRCRRAPWTVALLGIMVIPLGLVHIFLVLSQPLFLGAWCFLCLAVASCMVLMIPLETDEVMAMMQHMRYSVRKGQKFWDVFWNGSSLIGDKKEKGPSFKDSNGSGNIINKAFRGMHALWSLLLSILAGLLIACMPDISGMPVFSLIAKANHLCGALVVIISIISMGEVIRTLRLANLLIGMAIAVAPFFIHGTGRSLRTIDLIIGLVILLLSLPRGKIREHYGGWNKYII